MEKIIIKSEPQIVEKIVGNIIFEKIPNNNWSEAQIDAFVEKDLLGKLYKKDVIFQKKTGVKDIDSFVPSKDSLDGKGEIDVMFFDCFGNQNIDMIIEIKGGNSGLTEEFIYNNQPINEEDFVIVYSSSTDETTDMGVVSRKSEIKGENIKCFKGPAAIIARNGQAGKVMFIENGMFTISEKHAKPVDNIKKLADIVSFLVLGVKFQHQNDRL